MQVQKISSTEELKKAFNIRHTVFVLEQQVPAEDEYDEFDKTASHFLATEGDTAVGTARWRHTDKGIKLERFAVLQEYRNKNVGSAILSAVLTDLPDGHFVYLHAQLAAVNFYLRHGFVKEGDLFLECDIEHYKMYLKNE
jgi:predicted GNAT family N-acyltransferase